MHVSKELLSTLSNYMHVFDIGNIQWRHEGNEDATEY